MSTRKPIPVPQVVWTREAHSAPRWDLWLVAIVAVVAKLAGAGQP